MRENADEQTKTDIQKHKKDILVCGGTGCVSSDSNLIATNLTKDLNEAGLSDKIKVVKTGCFGFCEKGPIVLVQPDNVFYVEVKPNDSKDIVTDHISGNKRVDRLLYEDPILKRRLENHADMSFYKKQLRIALKNCGVINPEDVNEYIAADGFQALGRCLTEKKPEDVIEIIKKSGLRGRGGGGFPTGIKWETTRKSK